MQDFYKKI